jgi:hypothetical protein
MVKTAAGIKNMIEPHTRLIDIVSGIQRFPLPLRGLKLTLTARKRTLSPLQVRTSNVKRTVKFALLRDRRFELLMRCSFGVEKGFLST